jgi:hypothetical protein
MFEMLMASHNNRREICCTRYDITATAFPLISTFASCCACVVRNVVWLGCMSKVVFPACERQSYALSVLS